MTTKERAKEFRRRWFVPSGWRLELDAADLEAEFAAVERDALERAARVVENLSAREGEHLAMAIRDLRQKP